MAGPDDVRRAYAKGARPLLAAPMPPGIRQVLNSPASIIVMLYAGVLASFLLCLTVGSCAVANAALSLGISQAEAGASLPWSMPPI